MIQLLSNVARLPLAIFISSCEVLIKAMREMQQGFNRGMEVMAGGVGPVVEETLHTLEAAAAITINATTAEKETLTMVDQDLSGDKELKLVRYRILFTKRDHEDILHHGESLVNYSTTAQDFGGRMAAEWIKKYPLKDDDDGKYIQTFVEVLARYPKQEKEYDKRQVKVLEEIRDKI
jgi:hypothetical protein